MQPAIGVNPADVTPGFYPGLPYAVYRDGPGLAHSDLKLMRRSPGHYWAERLDPEREPEEESTEKKVGRAFHTLLLEPDQFEAEFAWHPDMNGNAKPVKAAKEQAAAEGKECLNEKYLPRLRRMKEAMLARTDAQYVFREGTPEVSIYWFDPFTGLLCKARIDWYTNEHELCDVKSALDCRLPAFQRAAWNYDYHAQAAHYTRGLEVLNGHRPHHFLWLAQEKESPFAVQVHRASQRQIEIGDDMNDEALDLFAQCEAQGKYPVEWGADYGPEIGDLGLPPWVDRSTSTDPIH